MPSRIYLETSILSFLTARPSSDVMATAHRAVTMGWWKSRRTFFDLVTSELVLQEVRRGDPAAAARRIAALEGIPLLPLDVDSTNLALAVVGANLLPRKAFPDALHIAIAAVHGVEYLLTWNCSHIANAELLPRVTNLVEDYGYRMPFVCTPEELMGETYAQ